MPVYLFYELTSTFKILPPINSPGGALRWVFFLSCSVIDHYSHPSSILIMISTNNYYYNTIQYNKIYLTSHILQTRNMSNEEMLLGDKMKAKMNNYR